MVDKKYELGVGLKKTLKNVGLTYGLPALVYFLNSFSEWMPKKYVVIAAPLIACVVYGLKNFVENSN